MIIEETINGMLFQEQRTYRIYASEEDRSNDNHMFVTSDEAKFLKNKELARKKERIGDKENKIIVF
jgi:hypothetical protein